MNKQLINVVFEPLEKAFGKLKSVRDDLEKFSCVLLALENSSKEDSLPVLPEIVEENERGEITDNALVIIAKL